MSSTILIVDDEASLARLLKLTLELSEQYRCLTANSGQEALDILKANRPDLVLMDLMMPGMSGLEALKCIMADKPSPPVIMMTAIETKEKLDELMAAGASGYLIKPIDFEELKAKLESLLSV